MALSMEEQRILTQIEVRLSEDDPPLAQRLARHGTPEGHGPSSPLTAAAVIIVLAAIGTAVAAAVLQHPPVPRPFPARGRADAEAPARSISPGPRRSAGVVVASRRKAQRSSSPDRMGPAVFPEGI